MLADQMDKNLGGIATQVSRGGDEYGSTHGLLTEREVKMAGY